MTSKKWCITFILSIILILICYLTFQILVDPFGIFGDPIFDWYSYNMTNNPRAAKIAYLNKNDRYKEYDSYMIGCSSTSSFSVEDLNKYFGGNYYNMIMYGADMLDVEQTCEYVVNNYGAKNLIVNIFLSNGEKYNLEEDPVTRSMHPSVDGKSKLKFYNRYLFLNPEYAKAKIKSKNEDSYLTKPYDVFNVKTGAYDKKVRDVEPIKDLEKYYEAYPTFKNYPVQSLEMTVIDETIESVKRIKKFAEDNNVSIKFVMAPAYDEYVKYYSKEQRQEFYKKLVEVTEFWDFTTSSLTKEPRFFYDETHFRNSFGKMAIAKMVNAEDIYYPEDIGEYVTKNNIQEHLNKQEERLFSEWKQEDREKYTKKIPIITYHSIVQNPKSNSEISPKTFEKQIKTFKKEGYVGVTFQDLINYVEKGIELPEKPICITFDDGYENNYKIAYPILKKENMKATIFVIGVSVGSLTNYKDTEYPITPHFTYEQAKEMQDSGIISIQSHTYDMHQWAPYEDKPENEVRANILKFENEKENEYIKILREDTQKIRKEINENLGNDVIALSYPSGKQDTLANVILKEEGIKATVTIEEGNNEIIKGLPQSLYALNRYNMDETRTAKDIIKLIEK